MPAAARIRVDGYVRVSRVGKRRGPRFISPSVQREAIEEWAARCGFELAEVFEELDESGARADRPLLELAIRRIEYGASSALVVWRVDRFGRSLDDGLRVIERIRSVGGGFYSVHDGLDISTDAGRLALRILLSVAEFQLDGMREAWDTARERAVRRGVHISTVPIGYRKTRTGRLRPHPVVGPLMTDVFQRRAAGESVVSLCRFLETHGVLTARENPGWNRGSLANMLKSRIYIGEERSGRYVNERAHPPLIDPPTWERAQRAAVLVHYTPLPVLLVAIARCAACRYRLTPYTATPDKRRPGSQRFLAYRCSRRSGAGQCPAPTHITADKLDAYVLDAALSILAKRRRRPEARLASAAADATTAAEALARYRDNDRILRTIGESAYLSGLAVRERRLSDANLALADARAHGHTHDLPRVGELRRRLPDMTLEDKREFVRTVIDAIFVARGRGPVEERVTICPAGTAPRDLPRMGQRRATLRGITPQRGWINPTTP